MAILHQMVFLFGTTALLVFSVRDPKHKKMFASESHGKSLFVSLRLKEHGALVIGKTNLDCREIPEFLFQLEGMCDQLFWNPTIK